MKSLSLDRIAQKKACLRVMKRNARRRLGVNHKWSDVHAAAAIKATEAEIKVMLTASKEASRCDWKEDIDGNWDTSCKQCMSFEYDPPAKQGYKFCHHCGSTINFINFEIEDHDI